MKTYRIFGWHGWTKELKQKAESLFDGVWTLDGNEWEIIGEVSLDSFANKWKDKFMVWPQKDGSISLCVTHKSSFNPQ